MSLLLHHVGLRLPLPDQQLTKVRAPQHDPVTGEIEPHGEDGLVTDGEAVYEAAVGEREQEESAGAEPCYENLCLLVVVGTGQVRSGPFLCLEMVLEKVSRCPFVHDSGHFCVIIISC